MGRLNFMQRRGEKLCFRMRMPKDLAGHPAPEHVRTAFPELINAKTGRFKRELTASLKTGERKDAAPVNARKSAEMMDAIEGARRLLKYGPDAKAILAMPSIDDIEADVFAAILAEDDADLEAVDERLSFQTDETRDAIKFLARMDASDEARAHMDRHAQSGLTKLEPGLGRASDAVLALEAAWTDDLSDLRRALGMGRPAIIANETRKYLKERGVEFQPTDVLHHRIGLAILRGNVRGLEARLERLGGKIVPTPKPRIVADRGPKLSDALSLWEAGAGARGGRTPSANSIREARLGVRRFDDLNGDLTLGEVTPAMARAFRDALAKAPIDLSGEERKLRFKAILQLSDGKRPTAHAATVNKQLNLLKAIFAYAEREGLLDKVEGYRSPFQKVSTTVDKRLDERRAPFAEADLSAIFSSPIYAAGDRPLGGAGEASYWLPLLALLTGCRLSELAQLRVGDVKQDEGVWHLDVDTSGGRSVKTASSRRKVPLHSTLIALGFLDYREVSLNDRGVGGDLWPDVKSAKGRDRGASFSQWFGRHLRTVCGVKERTKVFHSFRHTFKRLAKDFGVAEDLHDALTGHVAGGVGRSYGGGFGLRTLAAGLERIETPQSLNGVKRWAATARPA